jgi:hypothetical protein
MEIVCTSEKEHSGTREHNREEHNTPTTTHTRIRGTAYASATSESSDFLIIENIFNT